MRRQTRRSWAPALPRGARPRRRCHCRPPPPRWSRRLSRRHRSTQPSCACGPPGRRCRTAPSTRGISEDLITAVITRMRRELTIENARTPVPQHARNAPAVSRAMVGTFGQSCGLLQGGLLLVCGGRGHGKPGAWGGAAGPRRRCRSSPASGSTSARGCGSAGQQALD